MLALASPQDDFKWILIKKRMAHFHTGKDILCTLLKQQPSTFFHELFPAIPASQVVIIFKLISPLDGNQISRKSYGNQYKSISFGKTVDLCSIMSHSKIYAIRYS